MRDLRKIRIDVAVRRVIAGRHEQRAHIDRQERTVAEETRQLTQSETLASENARKDERHVDCESCTHHAHAGKRHAPAHFQADRSTKGQAEHHGDRRSHRDHAERKRPMLQRDRTRRHDRGNRPEDRVRAGNEQARCNEQLERGSHSAGALARRKQRNYREQQPPELETRCKHHERQRERHDRPCIDRGHHASLRLGKAEAAGDAAQKTDGHELRGVEYEGRAGEARERKPLPRRHGASAGKLRTLPHHILQTTRLRQQRM